MSVARSCGCIGGGGRGGVGGGWIGVAGGADGSVCWGEDGGMFRDGGVGHGSGEEGMRVLRRNNQSHKSRLNRRRRSWGGADSKR